MTLSFYAHALERIGGLRIEGPDWNPVDGDEDFSTPTARRAAGASTTTAGPGDSFHIYENTLLCTEDNAIRLRGTPRVDGMFVDGNMFAHGDIRDAVTETETGLFVGLENPVNNAVEIQEGAWDFDADGISDHFMATGATSWGVPRWG